MGRTSYVCGTGWYVMAITGVDNIHNMSESIMCMVIYHIICTLTTYFLFDATAMILLLINIFRFSFGLALIGVGNWDGLYAIHDNIASYIFYKLPSQVSQPDYILRRATLWVTWKVLSIKIPLSREGVMICFFSHQNIVRDQM